MTSQSDGPTRSNRLQKQIVLIPPDRLGVSVPFNESIIRKLKAIPGYRWDSERQCWSFPRSRESLERVLAVFRTDWRSLDHEVAEAKVLAPLLARTPCVFERISCRSIQALLDIDQ
jgi:hypothetical protein